MSFTTAQGVFNRVPVHPGHHQNSSVQPVLGNRWYETRFVKTELVDEGWAEGLHPASVSRA